MGEHHHPGPLGAVLHRALQRMYQRAYGMPPTGWRRLARPRLARCVRRLDRRLVAQCAGRSRDVGGIVFAIALSAALGFVVWLMTPRILLGRVDWRTAARRHARCPALLTAASGIYIPIVMTWSAERYGCSESRSRHPVVAARLGVRDRGRRRGGRGDK